MILLIFYFKTAMMATIDTKEMMVMLGARIAVLRRQAGFSQAELAQRLQISASAVGMYEQGRREPSLASVVQLSRAFGVSADYLLTGAPLTGADACAMAEAVEKALPDRCRPGGLSREELNVMFRALMGEQCL